MKIYGYQEENDDLEKLSEVTFDCSIEELEKIIDFLNEVKKIHGSVIQQTEYCHSHYRDWDKRWKSGMPDFIIVTKNTN